MLVYRRVLNNQFIHIRTNYQVFPTTPEVEPNGNCTKYQHLEKECFRTWRKLPFIFIRSIRSILGGLGVHHPLVDPWCKTVLFGLFGLDFFCNFYLFWCLWCFCCFGHKVSKLRFQALHNLAGIHILPRCMWSVKQGDSNWKSNHQLTGNLIATSPREANYLKGSWKKLPSTKSVKTNWDGLKHLHDSQNSTYQLNWFFELFSV